MQGFIHGRKQILMSKSALFWFKVSPVVMLMLVVGCKNRLWPSDQGFPAREIVFQIPSETSSESALGFIHPDGSELITRTVSPGQYSVLPKWSPDGKYISFRTSPGFGGSYFDLIRPAVVSSEGKTFGLCPDWEWNDGRVKITTKGELLQSLMLAEEKREKIVLADYRSCKVLRTLYETSSSVDDELLDGADITEDGWLAVGHIYRQGCPIKTEIVVVDPDSKNVQVVGNGLAPAWSPNGEWLAYTALYGIVIVRKDGSHFRQIVDIDFRRKPCDGSGWLRSLAAPSWSPDGKWLIYHQLVEDEPVIFKVNVESGLKIEVYRGGAYPDWRWGTPITDS